ncbi:MAG TPA: CBS domain-containing protein [Anaerolineales bacterium]|nr:CBS domain-containing protein [Anaerolineales bacterium]
MNRTPVRSWMSERLITITPETTFPEAQRLMLENKIRRLPVLQSGKLVGIVTLGDIREAKPSDATTLSIYELNYLMDKLTAKDFMTPNPITIAPDATLGEAARLMVDHRVGGLPVIDHGKLIGIITETDFCYWMIFQPEPIRPDHVLER